MKDFQSKTVMSWSLITRHKVCSLKAHFCCRGTRPCVYSRELCRPQAVPESSFSTTLMCFQLRLVTVRPLLPSAAASLSWLCPRAASMASGFLPESFSWTASELHIWTNNHHCCWIIVARLSSWQLLPWQHATGMRTGCRVLRWRRVTPTLVLS